MRQGGYTRMVASFSDKRNGVQFPAAYKWQKFFENISYIVGRNGLQTIRYKKLRGKGAKSLYALSR